MLVPGLTATNRESMTIIKTLIGLGVAIIPFFCLSGYNTREPKMVLALVISLLIGLSAFFFGLLKPIKNIFALCLVGFLALNMYLAPKFNIAFLGLRITNPWIWETGAKILIFFLLYCVMSSIDLSKKDKNLLFSAMVWCGFIMSAYSLFQYAGVDQFFVVKTGEAPFSKIATGGTLGQYTLVSSFIAMLFPLSIYQKRWGFSLIMGIALFIMDSQVAWGALVLSMLVYVALKSKAWLFIIIALLVLSVVAISFTPILKNPKAAEITSTTGRLFVWDKIVDAATRPFTETTRKTFPMTGMGVGSFQYLIYEHAPRLRGFQGEVRWIEAHNEYVEWFYTSGIIGLILMLLTIAWIIKASFIPWAGLFSLGPERRALLASFICICVCAFGTFVWHLGAHIFYTIVIAGLLSKSKGEF